MFRRVGLVIQQEQGRQPEVLVLVLSPTISSEKHLFYHPNSAPFPEKETLKIHNYNHYLSRQYLK
jgi:hypothetical protein